MTDMIQVCSNFDRAGVFILSASSDEITHLLPHGVGFRVWAGVTRFTKTKPHYETTFGGSDERVVRAEVVKIKV